MKGVDVSIFNYPVDWRAVKDAGIDFAIVRSSYGQTGFDDAFTANVNGAHNAGLICGAYHYSYALCPSDAIREAEHCKKIITDSGVLLELPVFFDMEDADGFKSKRRFHFSKAHITAICRAFLDAIDPLNAGVYASYSWLERYIDWKDLHCPIWNAQWSSHDFLQGYMWQYTDRLVIDGALFDGNILYDERDKPR